MWLFTTYGFYRAVCARTGDGRRSNPPDPHRIMVRARVRSHLVALAARFPDLLAPAVIDESPNADYAYRLFVDKAAWVRVVAALADEIDYDNFKSATAAARGPAGASYQAALHDVWAVMHRLQSR